MLRLRFTSQKNLLYFFCIFHSDAIQKPPQQLVVKRTHTPYLRFFIDNFNA
jgi:hypothetical protein